MKCVWRSLRQRCGPDDVISRCTDGCAANRAAAARCCLDLLIYRQRRGLKEGEHTGWRYHFLRSEETVFPANDSLPFDGTIRFFLWNTISGRRDGEHIHLWTCSIKRKLLIWGDASASAIKDQKRRRFLWLKVTPSRCERRLIVFFISDTHRSAMLDPFLILFVWTCLVFNWRVKAEIWNSLMPR